MEGTSVDLELCTDVWVVKNSDYVPKNCHWDLCLHILFTRYRLVPILHLEWYLTHNSMLTQHTDSYLMESFSQVCMQSAVLGLQPFSSNHTHDAVKGLGLSILDCLSFCENQFKSLVFFAYNLLSPYCLSYISVRWGYITFD